MIPRCKKTKLIKIVRPEELWLGKFTNHIQYFYLQQKNSKIPTNSQIQSIPLYITRNTGKYSKKEDASFSEEDGLLLLQLLSEGRTVAKIHSTCPPFQNQSIFFYLVHSKNFITYIAAHFWNYSRLWYRCSLDRCAKCRY